MLALVRSRLVVIYRVALLEFQEFVPALAHFYIVEIRSNAPAEFFTLSRNQRTKRSTHSS